MNPRNLHILKERPAESSVDENDSLNGVDFDKLKQVVRSSLLWIILIVILTNTLSFLYIRYTKPVYSSESILKLDIKSDAGLLGISDPFEQDIKGISGEVEILKSRLFASKVVDAVNMNVSYFHPGRSHLYDERYHNSPFVVDYTHASSSIYDVPIDIKILNNNSFFLEYTIGGVKFNKEYGFDENIKTEFFELVIHKTKYFDGQKKLINFYFTINSREKLIDYFQQNIGVEPVSYKANTIKISISDNNKHKARSLLKAIDTIYLAYTKSAKNLAVEQKIKFLEEQMKKSSSELEAFESYFETFTIKNRTTDLSKDLSSTIGLLNQLDSQSFNIRNQIISVDLAMEQINNSRPINVLNIPKEILKLVDEYKSLIDDKHIKIKDYNEKTQIITQLNTRIELAKSTAIARLEAYKENLITTREKVAKNRKLLENEFVELPSMETSYNKNRRLYALQEEFYFSLIHSKIELEIARAGTVTNFVVLSPASMPFEPIKPQKIIVLGGGFLATLIISFLFVAIKYLVDDTINSSKELERLSLAPLLGAIPKYNKEKLDVTRLVVTNNPKSAISESLRSIRTNMEFLGLGSDNKVLSITSTVSGEGKTFVAVNLGAIFAFSGMKVVVVDLDMRKPKVHMAFQDEAADKGASTILIGKNTIGDCLVDTEVKGLKYIGAGPMPPNPSELILGTNFEIFIEGLRDEFDIVILDTPPVGLVTDGVLVMKKCDLPMYVVRSEYSKKSYLKSVNSLISNQKFRDLSVIFNSVGSEGSYGYGYGYGSGYYVEDDSKTKSILGRIFKKNS